jgi:hypothetical protein
MSAGGEATAPRKHDPRKWGRLLRFGHANTKMLDHGPVDRGRIRVERRSFGRLGLDAGGLRAAADGRPLALAGFGAAPPYSCIRRAPVWLLLRFACVPTQDSDQV